MEKKINIEKVLKYAIMVYFILSPIFDLAFLYNHVTTLIRVAFLMSFACVTIIVYRDSRKTLKYLIAYYLAVTGYLAFDYLHAKGFISLVPGDFSYSLFSEAMTMIKLVMPFTIFFIMKYQDYSKKEFFRVINIWALLVAGSIIVCNVCGYSLSTYKDVVTHYTIFDWGKSLSVEDIATKGFFMYANQEAIVLLIVLVLTTYETLFEDKRYVVLVALVSLSLVMLGTRISTFGGLLVLVFVAISYMVYCVVSKRKISKSAIFLGVVVLGWILLLPISPNSDRVNSIQIVGSQTDSTIPSESAEVGLDDYEYFLANFNHVVFSEDFYKVYYPYQYDCEFWLDIVRSGNPPTNYRKLEVAIMKRIWKIDGRWTNYLFGFSNSRIQNVVNIEMDFVLHFFAFGIVGMPVLLFYYLYSTVILTKKLFRSREFLDYAILLCLGIAIFAAFLSGNSLNFLAVTVPLSFVCSFRKEIGS